MTKAEWKAMNEKSRWDIMCALRGPDCPETVAGWKLKFSTTAVIRNEMWGVLKAHSGSALRNTDFRAIIIPTLPPDVPAWKAFNFSHFLQHQTDAAHLLSIPVIKLPPAAWVNAIMVEGGTSYSYWLKPVWDAMTPAQRLGLGGLAIKAVLTSEDIK